MPNNGLVRQVKVQQCLVKLVFVGEDVGTREVVQIVCGRFAVRMHLLLEQLELFAKNTEDRALQRLLDNAVVLGHR